MIEATGLEKRYAGRTVLSVPHFTARAGEITAVVWPSAAGKSTLMQLLAGLEPQGEGTFSLDGHPADAAALRTHNSLVMQHPVALRGSVLYNAGLALRLAGWSWRARYMGAMAALERVGLAAVATQDARKLSGGELVRLALARALAKEPDAFLLDEATANLDPANIRRIEETIRGVAEGGRTVVMVTHNLPQARRLSHSTAVIYEGFLIAQDRTERIFNRHPNSTVRAFVEGEMVF